MLSTFTYRDLADEIESALNRATSGPKKDAWKTLGDVVAEVTNATLGPSDLDPTADARTWSLLSVQIEGFRGISNRSLRLDFDPTPGITVIHGPNGSGKSSICDAIDVALHQDVHASLGRLVGTGGKAPVWEPVLLHRDSGTARLRVELLSSNNERLTLTTHTDGSVVTLADASLADKPNGEVRVGLGEAWRSALAAYSPTYAYSTWEQRIQVAQDLQKYLERMLVLGGCFLRVNQAIEQKKLVSVAAEEKIKQARRNADANLRDAEREFERKSDINLTFGIDDDPAQWWSKTGLPQADQGPTESQGSIQCDHMFELSMNARQALQKLPVDDQLDVAVAHALHELDAAVPRSDAHSPCPVCGTSSPWRDHLSGLVDHNKTAIAAVNSWGQCLSELVLELSRILPLLLSASEESERAHLVRSNELLETLRRAQAISSPSQRALRDIAGQLMDVLDSSEFRREVETAVERASAESAWKRRQGIALRDMHQTWVDNREVALDAKTWADASRCLGDLEKRLKTRRQDALEAETNKTVIALLRDAGLEVARLNVQKRQADLVLRDAAGSELELGMLSAGQRNAVLLAPALAVAAGGPFNFVVIDDPVHSFDELRVDLISRQIIDISVTRRVIILTHDERLREHLLAAPTSVDSRSARRNPKTGVVEIQEVGPIWSVLLNDAEQLANLPGAPSNRALLTNTIRGLCRQAVDNALRLLVTREAVRKLVDPTQWLSRLDGESVGTTAQRLEAVESLGLDDQRASQVVVARETFAPFLNSWNKATHGNPPENVVTDEELKAARLGCEQLVK